jgi:peptidoglycan/xylan/chitin deacetylase (PgdA/CDA1 family)
MSIYEYGLPLLNSRGVTATAYIVPSWIEADWYLGWDEVQVLYEAGWDIGSHSMTHPRLTNLDDSTLHYELRQSQIELRERGFPADHFAVPFSVYDTHVVNAIRQYYKSNRVLGRLNRLPGSADPFLLYSHGSESWRAFEYYSGHIDKVASIHGWYIMCNHAITDDCDSYQWCISTQMLGDVIDYAHEKRVKIVTIDEALESVQSELAGYDPPPVGSPDLGIGISCVSPSPRFGSETMLRYSIPTSGQMDLRVYDVAGRLLQTLFSGQQSAGEHSAVWNGRDASGRPAAPGVYFGRLETGRASKTAKIIILK